LQSQFIFKNTLGYIYFPYAKNQQDMTTFKIDKLY
jgi:hypothetical protein